MRGVAVTVGGVSSPTHFRRLVASSAIVIVLALGGGAAFGRQGTLGQPPEKTSGPAWSSLKPTGIFSDMRYVDKAGDVIGTEVFIVATGGGYCAVVQVAEGVPQDPVVVSAKIEGSAVSFVLPSAGGGLRFVGTLTPDDLVGTLGSEKVRLRRGKS